MQSKRLLVAMGIIISVAFSLQGCISISFHSYKPIDISVLDAKTDAPIANAKVLVQYPHGPITINYPENISGTTDESGRVTLKIASYKLNEVI